MFRAGTALLAPRLTAAVLALVGCGSDADRRPLPGASCVRNSECHPSFICSLGRCREECHETRDCPDDRLCVVDALGYRACRVPDEESCAWNSDCPEPLVCAPDMQCRNACDDDGDCARGSQRCVASAPDARVCAEPQELLPEGGPHGPWIPSAADGKHPDAGAQPRDAPGSEGSPASDISVDGPAPESFLDAAPDGSLSDTVFQTDSSSAVAQDEPGDVSSQVGAWEVVPADAGNDDEDSGVDESALHDLNAGAGVQEGGAGGEDAAPAAYVEDPEAVEPLDNDNPEVAPPLPPAARLWFYPGDQDWFYVLAPDDGRAHVIDLLLDQDVRTRTRVAAFAAADHSKIGDARAEKSARTHVFVSVGPGSKTLFRLTAENPRGSGGVDVTWTMTPEADPHGVRATPERATPISIGQEVKAQLLVPYVHVAQRDPTDWYALPDLAAGSLTVTLREAPEIEARVALVDPHNRESVWSTGGVGIVGSHTFSVAEPGAYFLTVTSQQALQAYHLGPVPPAYMTSQYAFRVDQP